jgi:Holliday junction resolvasome RuvABC endonuclease subunit
MGKLSDLIRISNPKVLGIDASTNSFAFCIIQNGKAVKFGEINFNGATIYDRILDAKKKIKSLKATGIFEVDYISLEAAVVVRSVGTGIKMAYVFGAIMGELMNDSVKIIEVNPIEWQSYIGNKNFNKSQKELIKQEFPDKSDTWIKNKIRERRKLITIDFVKSLGVDTDNNNVSDAAGIAWFVYNKIGSNK